jgi:hypothetical protein
MWTFAIVATQSQESRERRRLSDSYPREGLGISLIVIAVDILVWTVRLGGPSPGLSMGALCTSFAPEQYCSEG